MGCILLHDLNTEFIANSIWNISRIRHRIDLPAGHWHALVKAKNEEGWSTFSNIEDLIVDGKWNEILIKNSFHPVFQITKMQSTNPYFRFGLLLLRISLGQTSGSSTLMAIPVSCIISIATLLSIYSISFSVRRFG